MKTLTRLLLVTSAIVVLANAVFATPRQIIGTWMVFNNGRANPMMKLVFSPNGTFKFAGTNYASAGYYVVTGNHIKLSWYSIDGQRVRVGTIKRVLELSPEGTFAIDQYTYAKYR
jgi:hypothetical protein